MLKLKPDPFPLPCDICFMTFTVSRIARNTRLLEITFPDLQKAHKLIQ